MREQFDRERHGSLYDRGSADSYYRRPAKPHWYPKGTYNCAEVVSLTPAEVAEYMAGYNENEANGNHK